MKIRWNPLVILPIVLALALILILDRPIGDVPALGRILNPFNGLWRVPLQSRLTDLDIQSKDIKEPVQVLWDEARVPHIQAKNEHDAYWAQGYVHASQRFFQMDLQSRAGQGLMAELLGDRVLAMDEAFAILGLREATRRTLAKMMADPETKIRIEAYSAGVNYWLKTEGTKRLPTEYRILGLQPKEWSPQSVAGLFVLMSFRLAGRTFDLAMTRYAKEFGRDKIEDLFPEFLPSEYESPYAGKDQIFNPPPDLNPPASKDFTTSIKEFPVLLQPFLSNGSNSWAVSANRGTSGVPIVANDTHLGFSLPSIWFEQQITYPGMNVYGAGFAGTYGVLVGFTEKVTWAVTNATTDVADWYEVKFKDDKSLEYQSPDGWKTANVLQEAIYTKNGLHKTIDLLWTDLGPVVTREENIGLVFRWSVHDGANALANFNALNRATSFADCQKAISTFFAPAQNFICADAKNIGITQVGGLPVRWKGQGRYVMDGSDPTHHWRGYYDSQRWPRSINPKDGAVWSGNQKPIGENSGLYMGWDSEEALRALRIREELDRVPLFDAASTMSMQQDTTDLLARQAIPLLIPYLIAEMSDDEIRIKDRLLAWDSRSRMDSYEATFFYEWWYTVSDAVWEDQLGERKAGRWPKNQRLILLLENLKANPDHSDKYWVEDSKTSGNESLEQIVRDAFRKTVAKIKPSDTFLRQVKLSHVARFPGFGELVPVPGSKYAINSMQPEHGPTWRMVVVQSDPVVAYTSVSGDASGEPLSMTYARGLQEWGAGKYKQVLFFTNSNSQTPKSQKTKIWSFSPEK